MAQSHFSSEVTFLSRERKFVGLCAFSHIVWETDKGKARVGPDHPRTDIVKEEKKKQTIELAPMFGCGTFRPW